MRYKNIINYVMILVIMTSLVGIVYTYNGKLLEITGYIIKGEVNGSNLNLTNYTKNIDLSSDFSFNGKIPLKVTSIRENLHIINISYDFDNSNYIGEKMLVEAWILDSNNTEIKRVQDSFSLRKEGLINRNLSIDLSRQSSGIYYLYMALSSKPSNSINQTIILGDSMTTGNVVIDNPKQKLVGYGIFIVLILAAVFLLFKNRDKDSENRKLSKSHDKNTNKDSNEFFYS